MFAVFFCVLQVNIWGIWHDLCFLHFLFFRSRSVLFSPPASGLSFDNIVRCCCWLFIKKPLYIPIHFTVSHRTCTSHHSTTHPTISPHLRVNTSTRLPSPYITSQHLTAPLATHPSTSPHLTRHCTPTTAPHNI